LGATASNHRNMDWTGRFPRGAPRSHLSQLTRHDRWDDDAGTAPAAAKSERAREQSTKRCRRRRRKKSGVGRSAGRGDVVVHALHACTHCERASRGAAVQPAGQPLKPWPGTDHVWRASARPRPSTHTRGVCASASARVSRPRQQQRRPDRREPLPRARARAPTNVRADKVGGVMASHGQIGPGRNLDSTLECDDATDGLPLVLVRLGVGLDVESRRRTSRARMVSGRCAGVVWCESSAPPRRLWPGRSKMARALRTRLQRLAGFSHEFGMDSPPSAVRGACGPVVRGESEAGRVEARKRRLLSSSSSSSFSGCSGAAGPPRTGQSREDDAQRE